MLHQSLTTSTRFINTFNDLCWERISDLYFGWFASSSRGARGSKGVILVNSSDNVRRNFVSVTRSLEWEGVHWWLVWTNRHARKGLTRPMVADHGVTVYFAQYIFWRLGQPTEWINRPGVSLHPRYGCKNSLLFALRLILEMKQQHQTVIRTWRMVRRGNHIDWRWQEVGSPLAVRPGSSYLQLQNVMTVWSDGDAFSLEWLAGLPWLRQLQNKHSCLLHTTILATTAIPTTSL